MGDVIDIRILTFTAGLVSLLVFVFMLTISICRKTYDGFNCWVAAAMCCIPCGILLSMRGYIPSYLTVVLSNTLVVALFTLVTGGLMCFVGFPVRKRHIIYLPMMAMALLLSYFTYVMPNVDIRIALISAYTSACMFVAGHITRVYLPRLLGKVNRPLTIIFFALAVFSIVLIVVTFATPSPMAEHMQFSGIHSTNILLIMVLLLAMFIGLIIINSQRVEHDLHQSLQEVHTLRGLLPICPVCKRIRDPEGYWQQLERYISEHSEAVLSHGICEDCAKEHYGKFYKSQN